MLPTNRPPRLLRVVYACCDELADISDSGELCCIRTLAIGRLKQSGAFCQKIADDFFFAVMGSALQWVDL